MRIIRLLLLLSLPYASANAGIAFGATDVCPAGSTNFTCSITTTGANVFMGVEISCGGVLTLAGTAVYGSTSLTAGPLQTNGSHGNGTAWWGLVSAGTQTLTVTILNSGGCNVQYVWYSGVSSVVQNVEFTCTFTGGSSGTCAENLTTTTTNGWILGMPCWGAPDSLGVNSPAVQRSAGLVNAQLADLGPVSAGSYSLTWNGCPFCGGALMEATMLELRPTGTISPHTTTGSTNTTGSTIKQ